MPALLKPDLEYHLATYAAPGKKGLLFSGPQGQPLRRASWYRAWHRALKEVGIEEDLKPHDLRHTANRLTAMMDASTKELMASLGQSSPRAALIYQHARKDPTARSPTPSRPNRDETATAPAGRNWRWVTQSSLRADYASGRSAPSPSVHVPTNTMSLAHGISLSHPLSAILVSNGS